MESVAIMPCALYASVSSANNDQDPQVQLHELSFVGNMGEYATGDLSTFGWVIRNP
jgi:hypothetical protein